MKTFFLLLISGCTLFFIFWSYEQDRELFLADRKSLRLFENAWVYAGAEENEDDLVQTEGVPSKYLMSLPKPALYLNDQEAVSNITPTKKAESYPIVKRFQAAHSEEKGVGNQYGYTSMGLTLGPAYSPGKFLPLAEISGAVFNDGTYAASAGVIFRYVPKNVSVLPGINFYYDARPGRILYQDVGVGLELLSCWFDLRANGYTSVGKSSSKKTRTFPTCTQSEFFATRSAHQYEFTGGDAEMGFLPINTNGGFLFYMAGGPYYLHSKQTGGIWGVQGRIQPQYKDYLALRVTLSSDRLFGTIVQGEVIFSIPLYDLSDLKNQKGPGCISNRQIYQPVERHPFVPLGNRCCWTSNF